jgi:hypothetical protein
LFSDEITRAKVSKQHLGWSALEDTRASRRQREDSLDDSAGIARCDFKAATQLHYALAHSCDAHAKLPAALRFLGCGHGRHAPSLIRMLRRTSALVGRSKGDGEILPVKITGTYDHPSYGLDK